MPWWDAQTHADRRPLLALRGRIKAAILDFFEDQDFTEVECGVLAVSPGNEAHLHAFATQAILPDGARQTLYLHTSPEFAAKKLLAAGEKKIFEFARVFRNRERGRLHVPEFTLLEWYRAHTQDSGADYRAVVADTLALLQLAAKVSGRPLTHQDRFCDALAEPQWLTVCDAFRIHAGIELLDTLSPAGVGNRDILATRARRAGFAIADHDGWSDIFSKVLAASVEPRLGLGQPTILYEYPRAEAALARAKPGDPRLAERFELYACGVELANGFGELTDPKEQRDRFVAEMDEKQRIYGERYPLDEALLESLAHMPPACGVALGFDRLVMLAAGAPNVASVLWTPLE